jgi:MFS family permease
VTAAEQVDDVPATPAPHRGWRAALAPLRHRNYALVWSAGLISNVGTWMETVAVGDLVARDTGEAGWTALVAAAGFLPMGLLGPVGGALADRLDRRKMLLAMTALQMLAAVALTALSAAGQVTPAAVALVVFVAGCVAGLGFPAYSAMLPDLVPPRDLLAGVSLSQAQWNLGRVVGPALAGLAIGLGSYTVAFAVNALSFAAMLLALRALRLPHRDVVVDGTSLWTRIRVGASAAWAEPGVRAAIVAVSLVALTASPFIALIPAMATVRFDGSPALTARFVTAQGVGAVLGALLLPALAERLGRFRMLLASFVLLPVALVLYGASPTAWAATAALALVGCTYMFAFSGLGTVVQLRAPADLRARVLSIYFLALGTLYPLGAALQGPIADRIGIGVLTAASGVALLVGALALAALRPALVRAMADPSPEVAVPAA